MKNYDNIDENGDNDGNEDKNDNGNAASGSGSNGPIFDLVTMPWCRGEGMGNEGNGTAAVAHYISTRMIIHLPYKYHIKYTYAKVGVLDLCYQNMKKSPV